MSTPTWDSTQPTWEGTSEENDTGFDSDKAVSNILPDAKRVLQGYVNDLDGGAVLPEPFALPFELKKAGEKALEIYKHPKEAFDAVTQPVRHPIKFSQDHPVQQAMNIVSLLTGLSGAARGALADSAIGERMAARTTSQALDLNPLIIRKMALKAGITPEEFTLKLGDQASQHLPEDIIHPLATANTKMASVLDVHKNAGEAIGNLVDKGQELTKNYFPEAQKAIDVLKSQAENYNKIDGGDKSILDTANRLEKLKDSGKLDFDKLHQMKSDIGSGFADKNIPPGTHEIFDTLNDATKGVVDRLAIEYPGIADQLKKLNGAYSISSKLIPAMARNATKEVVGSSVGGGIFSKAIPSAVGGALGGPLGALAGAGAKYAQEIIAPDLTKNLAYMAMKSGGLPSAPGLPIAALANNVAQSSQRQPISELIKQLKAKFEARRKM